MGAVYLTVSASAARATQCRVEMEPIGAHQHWGLSPACDLQQLRATVLGASCAAGVAAER